MKIGFIFIFIFWKLIGGFNVGIGVKSGWIYIWVDGFYVVLGYFDFKVWVSYFFVSGMENIEGNNECFVVVFFDILWLWVVFDWLCRCEMGYFCRYIFIYFVFC